jgi:hypothetical protein
MVESVNTPGPEQTVSTIVTGKSARLPVHSIMETVPSSRNNSPPTQCASVSFADVMLFLWASTMAVTWCTRRTVSMSMGCRGAAANVHWTICKGRGHHCANHTTLVDSKAGPNQYAPCASLTGFPYYIRQARARVESSKETHTSASIPTMTPGSPILSAPLMSAPWPHSEISLNRLVSLYKT